MATSLQPNSLFNTKKSGARAIKLPLAKPTQENAKNLARRYMEKHNLVDKNGKPLHHEFKIVNANELHIAHIIFDPATGKIAPEFAAFEHNKQNDIEPEEDTVPVQTDTTILPQDNSYLVEQDVSLALRAMETRLGIILPQDLFQEIVRDSVAFSKEAQAKDNVIQFEETRLPAKQLLPFGMQFDGAKKIKLKIPKISKSVVRLLNHLDHINSLEGEGIKWSLDAASLHLQEELKKKQDEQRNEDNLKKEKELRNKAMLMPGAELGLEGGPKFFSNEKEKSKV